MYKIAVMGYYDSIYGFAALGLDTISLSELEEAEKKLEELAQSGYAVIYITEDWYDKLGHIIERYKEQMLPAIIPIPGVADNTGNGVRDVKKFVEQAVGADILFNDNEN